jgi:hypothetical protein
MAFFLCSLLPANAQVVVGGKSPSDYFVKLFIGPVPAAKTHISALEKHLVDQDAFCSPHKRLIKEKNLMQAYLKLTLFRQPNMSTNQCHEANKYLSCMNSKAVRKHVSVLKENSKTIEVLKEKYKINDAEAKSIITFFDKLGTKVK